MDPRYRAESKPLMVRQGIELVHIGGSPLSCGLAENCEFGLYVIECRVDPREVPFGSTRYYVGHSAFPPETRFWEHMGYPLEGRNFDAVGSLPYCSARRLAPEFYALIGGFSTAETARMAERELAERLASAGLPAYMDGRNFDPPKLQQGLSKGWQQVFNEQHCDPSVVRTHDLDEEAIRKELDDLHRAIPHAVKSGLPSPASAEELQRNRKRILQSLYEARVVTRILRLKYLLHHRDGPQGSRPSEEELLPPGPETFTSETVDDLEAATIRVGVPFSLAGAVMGDFVLVESPTGEAGEISRRSLVGSMLIGLREGAQIKNPVKDDGSSIEVRRVG